MWERYHIIARDWTKSIVEVGRVRKNGPTTPLETPVLDRGEMAREIDEDKGLSRRECRTRNLHQRGCLLHPAILQDVRGLVSRWTHAISSLPPAFRPFSSVRLLGARQTLCPLHAFLPVCEARLGWTCGRPVHWPRYPLVPIPPRVHVCVELGFEIRAWGVDPTPCARVIFSMDCPGSLVRLLLWVRRV